MSKQTVRYPDGVVASIEELVADGVFESKSEFYRFSAEYVLTTIDPGYEPESFDFEEIAEELEAYAGAEPEPIAGETPFLEAVATLRKHAVRGEFEEAEAFLDAAYRADRTEAVVLEELLAMYRERHP
jgi:hypothetical protein